MEKIKNLYFGGTRNDTKGQMEIYCSEYLDGKYEEPVNLININTQGDEVCPFISPDGKYFFDSTRSGSWDIYCVDKKIIEELQIYRIPKENENMTNHKKIMKNAHLILIAASILAGMMLIAGCNSTTLYDVRGTWRFTGNYNDIDFDKTLTFSGDRTRGTVTDELNGTATYTSDGCHVNFDLSIICFCQKTWRGYFVDKNNMEGTLNGCSSGTWTASRN